ncbi:MAG: beta strand repeat-containing protein [Sulfuriferula sp.]
MGTSVSSVVTSALGVITDGWDAVEGAVEGDFLGYAQTVLDGATAVTSIIENYYGELAHGYQAAVYQANLLKFSVSTANLATAISNYKKGTGSEAKVVAGEMDLVGSVAGIVGSLPPGDVGGAKVTALANALSIAASGGSAIVGGVSDSALNTLNDFMLLTQPGSMPLGIYKLLSSNDAVVGAFKSLEEQASWYAQQVYSDITGSSSSSSTTSNNETEIFTSTTSGNATTETGNLGDTITNTLSGDALTTTTTQGFSETQQLSATGVLHSDTWNNAAATTGTDTYNADGSDSGKITYANGSYALYTDDGQGNLSTDYYTAGGTEIRATWVHADGTSGEVSLYGDGLTQIPGGGSLDVPESMYEVTQNPDGSYVTYAQDALDGYTNGGYSSTGAATSNTTGVGLGANDTVTASSTDQFAEQSSFYTDTGDVVYVGAEFTYHYNASGAATGGTWYSAYQGPNGIVNNPNGDKIAWAQNIMATQGSDTVNASGVMVRQATALDGSVWQDTTLLAGDTVSQYSGGMTLLSDQWSDYNGMTGDPALGSQAPVSGTPAITGSDTFNGNAVAGKDNTWTDGTGDQYVLNTATGALTISQRVLGTNSGDQIVIDHFNLNAAQTNAHGYLGIKFGEQLAAAASVNTADDPFTNGGTYTPATQSATVAVGNVQIVTLYASAASSTDQTVTVTGGSASAFISTGANLLAFNGTLNLVIPAGQNHVTFGLVDTSHSSSADALNLSASLTNADGTVSSNALTVTFDQPSAASTSVTPDYVINGDLTPVNFGTAANPQYHVDFLGNIVTSGSSPNFNDTLYGNVAGNDLIETGVGNNTVICGQLNDTVNAGGFLFSEATNDLHYVTRRIAA